MCSKMVCYFILLNYHLNFKLLKRLSLKFYKCVVGVGAET